MSSSNTNTLRLLPILALYCITFQSNAQIGFDYISIYQEILNTPSVENFISKHKASSCRIGAYGESYIATSDSLLFSSEVIALNNRDSLECIKISFTHLLPKKWSRYRQQNLKFEVSIKPTPTQAEKCLFSETYSGIAKIKLSRNGIQVKMKKVFIVSSSALLL